MCRELTPWEKCVEFHGHICPGLALGFKAAVIALNELGVSRAADEELVTIVENDACGVDAIQVLTGCTIGKGNLIYRDYGKQVYTFGNRKTGEAVRVSVKPDVMGRDPEHRKLMDLVIKGEATDEEYDCFKKKHLEKSQKIMELSVEEFCKVEKVKLDFPKKARIFDTIICAECGEGAMEPRVRVKDGKMVCLVCAGEEYTRGW
ncbi:formylmethanofuran dehydrogenase, subunit E [Carboxydocella thermautotrophica]|nr:formylmethanofuran dehydrogenase, subunit E [Carboxydocella thermautotrophica]